MEAREFAADYLKKLADVVSKVDAASIGKAVEWMRDARRAQRMVYSCGNGGSALIASQMVVDIVKGASYGRPERIKMIGLSDNMGTVTAYANDVSYDVVFVEQLRNFATKDDVLIGISGSGNSKNVLLAIEYANSIGCKTIGITTSNGGRLKDIAQLPLLVPSDHMGRLEDCFFAITHILCYAFIEGML